MERTTRYTFLGLLAVLAGVGICGVLYRLTGQFGLALVTGLCWACGLGLTFHVGRLYPAYATGETWADKRWTGSSVGIVTLAALVGVSPTLPLSSDVRFGLGLLVLGAGLVAYAAGTLAVLERVEGDPNATSSNLGATVSTDDD